MILSHASSNNHDYKFAMNFVHILVEMEEICEKNSEKTEHSKIVSSKMQWIDSPNIEIIIAHSFWSELLWFLPIAEGHTCTHIRHSYQHYWFWFIEHGSKIDFWFASKSKSDLDTQHLQNTTAADQWQCIERDRLFDWFSQNNQSIWATRRANPMNMMCTHRNGRNINKEINVDWIVYVCFRSILKPNLMKFPSRSIER